MMTLPETLQLNFEQKLTNYREEIKMPLLSNMERRGLEKGTRKTSQKHIIKILEKRFGNLPENLVNTINQIDDISVLDDLHLESISVNSVVEFQNLINLNSSN
jgi:hypothetical protein